MAKSFQDRRKEKQKASFIGRSKHIGEFTNNLDNADPINIFNIHGQGGVGKSYLVSKYRNIAEENNCLVCYSDESVKSVLQWMEGASAQFKASGVELSDFDKRYKTYLQEIKKLETDPEKPKGTFSGIIKAASRGLLKEGKKLVPGAAIISEFIDEESLSSTIGEWAEFARKKIANKDEVELVLEPEKVLTPLFWKGVAKHADEKKFICLFIDTYEEVDAVLEKWLLDVLEGKHGDIPANILLIIAGREELNANTWLGMKDLILKIQLEPFTPEEAKEYLDSKGVTNDKIQENITTLSGCLPVLMAWLTDVAVHNEGMLEDFAQTAVERFLKWVQDENQRTIALAAALPRKLNQDIIENLLEDKTQAKSNFKWLTQQPFVLRKGDHWVYHNVVRDQMLRYVRIRSAKEWNSVQECLEKYYAEQQIQLDLQPNEEFLNTKWMEYEHEKEYHQLCFKSEKFTPLIMQQFVRYSYELAIDRADVFGETLLFAGKDVDNELSRKWGNRISSALKEAYNDYKYESLHKLVKDIQAQNWIKNDTHRAFLLLVEGITQPNNDEAIKTFQTAIDIVPGYAEAYYNLGIVYARKNSYDEAIAAYLKAIELKPDYMAAYTSVGLAYSYLGQYDKTIDVFSIMVEVNPDDYEAWFDLGSAYFNSGNYDESIRCFGKVTEENPNDFQAYNNLGISWYNKDAYDKATDCYLQALKIKPEYYLANYNLGLVKWQVKEYNAAIESLQKAITSKPDYYFAYVKLGETYIALDRWEEAITALRQTLALKPDYSNAYYFLGFIYNRQKQSEKAIEAYTQAVVLKPDDYEALGGIALAYFDMKEYDRAMEVLEKAFVINADFYVGYTTFGMCLMRKGEYEKSIIYYLKSLSIKENYGEAMFNLGLAYDELKDFGNAVIYYEKLVAVLPTDFEAFYRLGRSYGQMQQFNKAIEAFEKSIAINDGFAACYTDLTWAAVSNNEYEKAIENAAKALSRNPQDKYTYFNLGLAYFSTGKYYDAIAAYKEAISLPPDSFLPYAGLGRAYEAVGDVNQSIAMYEKAVTMDDHDYDMKIRLAMAYSANGHDTKANAVYDKMIEQFPGTATPYMNLGYSYLKNGNLDNAETFLLKAKAMASTDYSSMNAGHVYLVKGDALKAQECYEEGLSLASSEEVYFKDMYNDYSILQQYGVAQDNYEELIKKLKRPVKTPTAH